MHDVKKMTIPEIEDLLMSMQKNNTKDETNALTGKAGIDALKQMSSNGF